jgi:hypothetical protein
MHSVGFLAENYLNYTKFWSNFCQNICFLTLMKGNNYKGEKVEE